MPEEEKINGFNYVETEGPYAFMQYKNTDICFDFYCDCGAHCHFDGYFAHYVKCPHCETCYEMPFNLFPRKMIAEQIEAEKDYITVLQPDEDYELE